MSDVLDALVRELEQFRAIRSAANAWAARVWPTGASVSPSDRSEFEAARRLSELATDAQYGAALEYLGANEAQRVMGGERSELPSVRASVARCVRCGLSPAEADHRGAWTFPFSRFCPSCSAIKAPAKRRRH